MTPPDPREPVVERAKAIAAVLSELFGVPVSEDAVYRLSSRDRHPLPVDGYGNRVYTTRSKLEAWAREERTRRGRTPVAGAQLDLFGGDQ